MLSSLCVSLPSQVTRDFETFSKHSVGLVIFCELHENHHNRATLPPLSDPCDEQRHGEVCVEDLL